jgi:hypothetical protein
MAAVAARVYMTLCGQVIPATEQKPETTCLRQTTCIWKNVPAPPAPFIYEKGKPFPTEPEKQSWQPRIAMIETAKEEGRIFSISIVPTDPKIFQTWFYKKSAMATSDDMHGSFEKKEFVTIAEDAMQPQRLLGFVKPFPSYNSMYAPTLDPQEPGTIPISKIEDIPPAIADLLPDPLRERVEIVLRHFFNDPHARAIGLTVFHHVSASNRVFIKA